MAGKPKKTGKAKTTDKEQSERFKETARELEADETGEQFEKALKKLMTPKNSEDEK